MTEPLIELPFSVTLNTLPRSVTNTSLASNVIVKFTVSPFCAPQKPKLNSYSSLPISQGLLLHHIPGSALTLRPSKTVHRIQKVKTATNTETNIPDTRFLIFLIIPPYNPKSRPDSRNYLDSTLFIGGFLHIIVNY